jgi:hypothetical protein
MLRLDDLEDDGEWPKGREADFRLRKGIVDPPHRDSRNGKIGMS